MLDPPRAGLTKTGKCSAGTASRQAPSSRSHSAGVIDDERADRQPGRRQHQLHELLVHARPRWPARRRRRSGCPSSRTGPGWCRPRRTVRAAGRSRRRPGRARTARLVATAVRSPAIRSSIASPGLLAQLRQPAVADLQGGMASGSTRHPASAGGDADADHLVAIGVERAEHPGGRQAGDAVLAAGAAEDHRDPRPGLCRVTVQTLSAGRRARTIRRARKTGHHDRPASPRSPHPSTRRPSP